MKPSPRALTVALTAALLSAGAAAQQTLTFDNTSPAITVQLQNGQNMTIQTNGNVTARCVTQSNGSGGTTCVGLPTGGGGGLVSASIAASNFSQTPDGNNQYPAGTQFTITPTVSNAEVCLRQTAPSNTGWTGAITSFSAAQFSLPTASTTYGFTLKCFGEGGFATSNTITLATNAGGGGGGGGGDQCGTPPPGATPPNGYTLQTPPASFAGLPLIFGAGNCSDFPNTGATLCRMSMSNNRYMSLKFTMPANISSGNIVWEELQAGAAPADLVKIYFSVSQCPGDFRIPTQAIGPANDPTHGWACRNYQANPGAGSGAFRTGISYLQAAQSTSFSCGLTPGNSYYFNFVMADPSDGAISAGEGGAACTAANGVCGVQLFVTGNGI